MAIIYDFENRTAFNPETGEGTPNAVGQVYAKTDTTFATPLVVTLMGSGLSVTDLTTDQYCQLQGFQAADLVQVVFKSGDFTKVLNTTTPLVGPAGPAVADAVDNGDGTVTFTLPDGSPAATVALPVSTTPGPEGPEGPRGLPGVNAIPAADAVATYATTPGNPVNTALSATIASEVEEKTGGTATLLHGYVGRTAPENPNAYQTIWVRVPFVTDPDNLIDATANLLVRYRMNDVDAADGTEVATISPRSGSVAADLTAPEAKPSLVHGMVGGKRGVRLLKAQLDYLSVSLGALSTPITVFMVADVVSNGYVVSGQLTTAHAGLLASAGLSTIRANTSQDLGNGVSEPWSAADPFQILAAVYEPGTGLGRFYKHKLTAKTGSVSSTAVTGVGNMFIGRAPTNTTAQYTDLDVADFAVVSGAMADADVKAVMQDYADYYGLTLGA